MKKILYIAIALLGMYSCSNDLLEPFTPGALTDEIALVTSGDIIQIKNSSMQLMANRNAYTFSSIFTDEAALGFNNGGQGRSGSDAYFLYYLDPSSAAPDAIWQSNYYALARINRLLEKVDQIVPKDDDDKQILNRNKAEALVLRALAHLKVMAYFSPNLKDDSALAGILANRIIGTNESLGRATNGEFYKQIHKDLDDALAIFSTNIAPPYPAKSWYASANLAKGLKARAYAYKGDYTNAEKWADDVINTSGVALANSAQITGVFHANNSGDTSEVIFKFRRSPVQNSQAGNANPLNFNANLHNGWVSVSNARNGSPFYEVSRALYDAYKTVTGDVRLDINVRPAVGSTGSLIDANPTTSVDIRSTDILVPFKFGGSLASTASNGFNQDYIEMRISEMYFIKAEARAAAGDFAGVSTTLKKITDNRFITPPAALSLTSATQAYKAILDERRKELAFEGHRFIDLKRLYSLAGVNKFDRSILDYGTQYWNVPGADPANFVFANNNKWALPIPQSELNANSSIVQNPGY